MTSVTLKAFFSPDEEPLQRLLNGFTYRPDWSFVIENGVLVVRALVIDTDNTGKIIPLQFGIGLPSRVRPGFDWTRWLFDQIMEVERHEAQEFFKINGIKVFDPHA